MSDNPELSHKHDFLSVEQTVRHGVPEQLLVLDCKLGVLAASKSFYTSFQVAPGDTVRKKLGDLGNGQWNISALLTHLNEMPKVDGERKDIEMEYDSPALGPGTLLAGIRRLAAADPQSALILLSMRDITARKRMEAEASVLAKSVSLDLVQHRLRRQPGEPCHIYGSCRRETHGMGTERCIGKTSKGHFPYCER